MSKKTLEANDLPCEVVYYNRWTGFDSHEIGRLFECIPVEELAKLKTGATIWLDTEQPSGKVYGYTRAEVISVTNHEKRVGISFKGPYIEGGATIEKKSGWHKVHRCTDTAKLLELTNHSPLATETGSVGSISEKSRKYLENQGARIRRAK